TTIKNEEIRRLIIYTFLYEIYNKISLDNVFEIPKVFIVLDEAWTILKAENEDYPIVADLIKRGRGHGISIIMATQNIEDLGELANIYLDNVGLALFMNNGDRKFWEEVKRFTSIDDELIGNRLMYLNKGEALIRFLGDPRPILMKLDLL
ncbi:AAA family ATPase, partial [Sulfolobus sp. A20-N-F8]